MGWPSPSKLRKVAGIILMCTLDKWFTVIQQLLMPTFTHFLYRYVPTNLGSYVNCLNCFHLFFLDSYCCGSVAKHFIDLSIRKHVATSSSSQSQHAASCRNWIGAIHGMQCYSYWRIHTDIIHRGVKASHGVQRSRRFAWIPSTLATGHRHAPRISLDVRLWRPPHGARLLD